MAVLVTVTKAPEMLAAVASDTVPVISPKFCANIGSAYDAIVRNKSLNRRIVNPHPSMKAYHSDWRYARASGFSG